MRIRMLADPREVPREVHDQARELFRRCYAEVGYPNVLDAWSEQRHCYYNLTPVPEAIHHRASALVADALGLPYEVLEE